MEYLKQELENLNKHYERTIALIVGRRIALEESDQMTEVEIKEQVTEGILRNREQHDKNMYAIRQSLKFNERKLAIIEKMMENTKKAFEEEEQRIREANDDGLYF